MAIVPVKPLAQAKGRLAAVLAEPERIELARALLERTLLKLARARGIARVAVISRDDAVLRIARRHGAWSILESGQDLNAALEQSARSAAAGGIRAVLVIPADLPLLRVRDIEKLIALGEEPPVVVLAPARRDGGTNAMLTNPIGLIPFSFGADSFAAHQLAAQQVGARVATYSSENVAIDIDVPEDLQYLPPLLRRTAFKRAE